MPVVFARSCWVTVCAWCKRAVRKDDGKRNGTTGARAYAQPERGGDETQAQAETDRTQTEAQGHYVRDMRESAGRDVYALDDGHLAGIEAGDDGSGAPRLLHRTNARNQKR